VTRDSAPPLALGLFAIVAWVGAPRPLQAQDAHYWSRQYGTRSELLGGTVVGSPQDLSTTFYNPGGLAFLESPRFLLSAVALEYEQYRLSDTDDPESGFVVRRLAQAPALVTGTLPDDWTPGRVAFSYLVRQKLDARVDDWFTVDGTPTGSVANVLLDHQGTESWGGVTWSVPAGRVGLGVSVYGAFRNRRGRTEIATQQLFEGIPESAVSFVDDYRYWHLRALAKLGVYWSSDRLTMGLTLTTRGLSIAGRGDASFYRSVQDTSGVETAGLVADRPEVTYHSPASMSLGARYPVGRGAVYLTTEWFEGVASYRVLSDPGLADSGQAATLAALVTQELDRVINVGVGVEHSPSDRLTFFGSVITDFAAASEDPASNHAFSTWDLYQFSLGAAFTALDADFTLGASYAGGEERVRSAATVAEPGGLPIGTLSHRRWKIFLGFELSGRD
jgi:hypothetical protein